MYIEDMVKRFAAHSLRCTYYPQEGKYMVWLSIFGNFRTKPLTWAWFTSYEAAYRWTFSNHKGAGA